MGISVCVCVCVCARACAGMCAPRLTKLLVALGFLFLCVAQNFLLQALLPETHMSELTHAPTRGAHNSWAYLNACSKLYWTRVDT